MLKVEDKEIYPLDFNKAYIEGKLVYDKDKREKAWFYLYLSIPPIEEEEILVFE